MGPLELVNLSPLMQHALGRREMVVGLVDGPVFTEHVDLQSQNIREIPGKAGGACKRAKSTACIHGTFIAGILSARRGSVAPAICPGCTLVLRPIFSETRNGDEQIPNATPEQLAEAIWDTVKAGARIINLSVALERPSPKEERPLQEALDHAARRGVIIVAAAGNQGTVGSSVITRHPGVVPVVAFNLQCRPLSYTNLGNSLGRRGLGAPGEGIVSLGTNGKPQSFGGTSAAAPFVTGALALLWSEFHEVSAVQLKNLLIQGSRMSRRTIVPPLLDAWAVYRSLSRLHVGRNAA